MSTTDDIGVPRPSGNRPFTALFPGVGAEETRWLMLPQPSGRIPAGEYAFLEFYCVDRECDCRRVLLKVMTRGQTEVGTISHSFEWPPSDPLMACPEGQTFLDPLNPKVPWAEDFLDMFGKVVLADVAYRMRLKRHYALVKEAITAPGHPIHDVLATFPPDRSVEMYASFLARSAGLRMPTTERAKSSLERAEQKARRKRERASRRRNRR